MTKITKIEYRYSRAGIESFDEIIATNILFFHCFTELTKFLHDENMGLYGIH